MEKNNLSNELNGQLIQAFHSFTNLIIKKAKEEIREEFFNYIPMIDMNNDCLLSSVKELGLSVRAANGLQRARIRFVHELVQRDERYFLRVRDGFGRKTILEIKEALKSRGLFLGMKIPQGTLSKIEDKALIRAAEIKEKINKIKISQSTESEWDQAIK